MTRFQGVAVVTGGAQGIGEGVALRLGREGAKVAVADINLERARETAHKVNDAGGQAQAIHLDVADPDSVGSLGAAVQEAFGEPYRYLVCNAGIQTFRNAVDLPIEEWDSVLDVNARGTLLCMQEASRSQVDGGSIVAMASIQGRLGGPYYPHYSASKAAVLSLVKSFALALAHRGIRVNAVAPGMVDTPLWERADRELSALKGIEPGSSREARIASIPLKRAGTPEDMAAATAFMLSDDASYITGECLHVCGGDVML